MEFFNKSKAVRLKSHLHKYLIAGDDGESVRQSRNGSSRSALWVVESVGGRSHVIRLRSSHGRYLTTADEPFLLGVTGKKVLQARPEEPEPWRSEWEPMKEGGPLKVKLRAGGGKFLCANGGTPPWRNSVTHDAPHRTATRDWFLWEVDMVELEEKLDDSLSVKSVSPASSILSVLEDCDPLDDELSVARSVQASTRRSGMELFNNAKSVCLRSHRDRYLLADEDEESVSQERRGSSKRAKWAVEIVDGGTTSVIRLKSCYGKYLTATDFPFLLGVTGKKVLQTMPRKLDSCVEWEPLREGFQVRLKTRYGNFLRANGGLPPWRNSITHDIPHRTATQDWVLWDVEVVETRPKVLQPPASESISQSNSSVSDLHGPSLLSIKAPKLSFKSPKLSKLESSNSFAGSPMKNPGRDIYYSVVADGEEEGDDNAIEESMFNFKGNGVEELRQRLEEETGLEGIIVCSRNPLNGKLYPLRLALPPKNTTMHVVVVPPSYKGDIKMPKTPTTT